MQTLRPCVFLDRDGVINPMVMIEGKLRAPLRLEDFELFEGVVDAVRDLRSAGYLTVVVTNQPDVARGWQRREIVEAMNERVRRQTGVDRIEVCYHDYPDRCGCRKPKPGMLLAAAGTLGIDLARSYLVGDRYGDVLAAHAAGCTSILVGPGDAEAHTLRYELPTPAHQTHSLREAADWILSRK